jgi:hypothetical protein
MPTTVSLVIGVASAQLNPGDRFVWVNPTLNQVTITDCIGFCTQASYTIPARTATGPGETAAQINPSPYNWEFMENPPDTWSGTGLGMPHIQNPTSPAAEVA